MSSAAELALKKKYALLKKRQEAAGGGGCSGAGGGAAAAPAAASQDPGRMAAIRALQAKRAAAGVQQAAPAGVAQGSAPPAVAPTKLKLVIPKRDFPAAAQTGKPGMAADPGRAAALAALRAKASGGAAGSAARQQQQAQQQQQQQQAQLQQQQEQQAPKRPSAPKRPTARPRPTPQQQLQAAAGSAAPVAPAALDGTFGPQDAVEQQQQLDQYGGGAGGCFGAEDDGRAAKRQRTDNEDGEDEVNTTLFCGDLPPYWASADLLNFFGEFGEVLEARVIGSQCYGFVRFARVEDAEGVLEFAQQQGMWADERMLRINWSQGSMPDWKKGPAVHRPLEPGEGPGEAYEHPRVREARLQAQQVAAAAEPQQIAALAMQPPPQRHLVSYEDL